MKLLLISIYHVSGIPETAERVDNERDEQDEEDQSKNIKFQTIFFENN